MFKAYEGLHDPCIEIRATATIRRVLNHALRQGTGMKRPPVTDVVALPYRFASSQLVTSFVIVRVAYVTEESTLQ
jgi:hypothetical protein